jgi:hypothetical protein
MKKYETKKEEKKEEIKLSKEDEESLRKLKVVFDKGYLKQSEYDLKKVIF